MEILALIPARSGSKGVPNKNILEFAGMPLMAHTIKCALSSKLITRVIVSTDSDEYMMIAKKYGAETPFKRPIEFAADDSPDIDVFYHALTWLQKNEAYMPDICVHLRPCYPIREPEIVDNIVQYLIDNPQLDCVRSLAPSKENPYKTWRFTDDNTIVPVITDIPEGANMPRQKLPATYFHTSYADAFWSRIVVDDHTITGNKVGGFIAPHDFDIDNPEDLKRAHEYINQIYIEMRENHEQ